MKKIFYERVGRRYRPVYEYDSDLLDALPQGTHMIQVYPGGKSTRYNVDPAIAPMVAAGRVAEDAVCRAIAEAQELRPKNQPITETQQALWRALAHSFNQQDYPLIRPAARDAAEAAVRALEQQAEQLLNNPVVRKAYERFLFIAELAGKGNGTDHR